MPTISFLILFITTAPAQVLNVGESFDYSVTWLGLRLGGIEVDVLGADSSGGSLAYRTRYIVASNPIFPFSVRDTMWSNVDKNVFSRGFLIHQWSGDEGLGERYRFDYTKGWFDHSAWIINAARDTHRTSFRVDTAGVHDGVSGVYILRKFAGKDTSGRFLTIIKGEPRWTNVKWNSHPERLKLPKNGVKVDAYRAEGSAEYEGFRGFTGKWKAWFTTDDRRVPLYGEADVWLGHVKIEIEKRDLDRALAPGK